MAESATPVLGTPVDDRRPVPRGVLPRRMQTWLMAGIAGGMLLIMLVVGRPQPAARTAPTMPVGSAQPTPDRLREYQDRLRIMEVRAAQEAAQAGATAPAAAPSAPVPEAMSGSTDPIEADRKRRAYESLFASNVVVSRRPADQQPAGNGDTRTAPAASLPGRDGVPGMPNVDDVATAVVRATSRYAQPAPGAGAGSRAADSMPSAASAPSTTPFTGRQTPQSTEPIRDTGPTHRLLEGTVIDAVLTNRLDGATANPVNCLVTNPIYAHSGQQVLIPAGSRVLGETKAVQSVGESRLAVAFHRLLFPDGRTVSLDQFIGLNALGDAALRDQVNHHYWSTFGAAAAIGVISGLGQSLGTVGLGQGGTDRTVVIAGGVGNATSEATAQVMNRFLNRLPTITIREGHRVKVYLTSDLELPAYDTQMGAPVPAR